MDTDTKFAIHAACREGKLSTVQSLLNVDSKLITRKDDDGRYPVHWATSANQLDITQLLAEQKGFDVDVKDDMGWTPLMIAASVKDSEKLVAFLLSRSADPNERNNTDQTVLHFVASKNYLDIARLLMTNNPPASARVRDKRGQYALHRAAAVGAVPMITLLVQAKSPLNATDNDGQTALHHAVAEGHGDAAVALIKAGAELGKEDAEGKKALDLAPGQEVRKYITRMAENEGIEL